VRGERGQATVEFIMLLFLFALIFSLALYFGRAWYLQLALDTAAPGACRQAAEALLPRHGFRQALRTARETMEGFHLDPAGARVTVMALGPWRPGTEIVCRVSYTLDQGDIPLVGWFGAARLRLEAEARTRIETHKSDWWGLY